MKDDGSWMWDVRVGKVRRFGWKPTRREAIEAEAAALLEIEEAAKAKAATHDSV